MDGIKMTIGIIEDDRLLSRSLKVVLEKEGYRTLQVLYKERCRADSAGNRGVFTG